MQDEVHCAGANRPGIEVTPDAHEFPEHGFPFFRQSVASGVRRSRNMREQVGGLNSFVVLAQSGMQVTEFIPEMRLDSLHCSEAAINALNTSLYYPLFIHSKVHLAVFG